MLSRQRYIDRISKAEYVREGRRVIDLIGSQQVEKGLRKVNVKSALPVPSGSED